MKVNNLRAINLSMIADNAYQTVEQAEMCGNVDHLIIAIDDLLDDRVQMIAILAHEMDLLTEKQAADVLGLDRLDFRQARMTVISYMDGILLKSSLTKKP